MHKNSCYNQQESEDNFSGISWFCFLFSLQYPGIFKMEAPLANFL